MTKIGQNKAKMAKVGQNDKNWPKVSLIGHFINMKQKKYTYFQKLWLKK